MISKAHQIIICQDGKKFFLKAAHILINYACKYIKEKGSFNIALSGGSTPRLLFDLLSDEEIKNRIDWKNVHLFWGDERAAPPDDEESNFRMASDYLFNKVNIPDYNIHRIKAEHIETAADQYQLELLNSIGKRRNGVPVFDLVLLGMGTDGHTASLFPQSKALYEKEKLILPVYVEKLDSMRITITPPVIREASNILLLVCGKEKSSIIEKVFEYDCSMENYPVLIVNACSGNVMWLLDNAASAKLSKKKLLCH